MLGDDHYILQSRSETVDFFSKASDLNSNGLGCQLTSAQCGCRLSWQIKYVAWCLLLFFVVCCFRLFLGGCCWLLVWLAACFLLFDSMVCMFVVWVRFVSCVLFVWLVEWSFDCLLLVTFVIVVLFFVSIWQAKHMEAMLECCYEYCCFVCWLILLWLRLLCLVRVVVVRYVVVLGLWLAGFSNSSYGLFRQHGLQLLFESSHTCPWAK